MARRNSVLRAFVPLGVTAVLACWLFVGSFLLSVRHIDRTEKRREELLVASDVSRRLTEIQGMISPFVIWDEAVQPLGSALDQPRTEKTIGRALVDLGFSRVVILDSSDRPRFAAGLKGEMATSQAKDLMDQAGRLLADVRRVASDPVRSVSLHSPQESDIATLGGRPVVVTASLVRPGLKGRGRVAPASAILSETPVEAALLSALATRFHLTNAHIVYGQRSPRADASITLASVGGGRSLKIAWTPQRPGAILLSRSSPYLVLAMLVLLAAAAILIAHARRITRSLLKSRERAAHLAFHDSLTGLANRALLGERLESARRAIARSGGGYAVLCLDLDRFKEVNDIYGHAAGDQLIRDVGNRLRSECRSSDTIARLGGDEFAIVMLAVSPAAAASLAKRIVDRISGSVELMSGRALLSCSIGVAAISDPQTEPLEALRQADLALYRAKMQGRSRFCFFEQEMDAAVKSKKALEDDLRLAIAEGDLDVVYQPIVEVDGEMVAVEALARWTDPARGPVPPSVFIPLAEEAGLISPIGLFVFRRVCEDSLTWPGVRLSVNLSPVQIRRPDLIESIEAILQETGADPSRFDLEITESCLLQDDSRTHDVLARLRALGFGFSLDDFGTGYSSLSYLHRYPVQKIKLDRSFVSQLSEGPQGGLIVASLILLARALDLKVIAEGVETQDQLLQLIDFGCNQYQGFLFSRPVSREAISSMVGRPLAAAVAHVRSDWGRALDR